LCFCVYIIWMTLNDWHKCITRLYQFIRVLYDLKPHFDAKIIKINKFILNYIFIVFIWQSLRSRTLRKRFTYKYVYECIRYCTSFVSLFNFSIICNAISIHKISKIIKSYFELFALFVNVIITMLLSHYNVHDVERSTQMHYNIISVYLSFILFKVTFQCMNLSKIAELF
jgi:hypothetical protein